ncbi:unnamed protein product [Pleuronectes platessa]|uniref:Ig-like domain-containing protein n=1 Tax=Pleuronectes platessa TaxID=8262 RepID=A0A9N7YS84_PLEPL|nr:unnamed protein product [Pleuronectes platessa]
MSAFRSLVVLILIMWTLTTADGKVCVLAESCILNCSFHPGKDPVIHWKQVEPGNTLVHSYYNDKDQFDKQSEHFRGRTSLFTDQISRGNASIRLTGLQLQDQGSYKCFTSIINGGSEESIINLTAEEFCIRDSVEPCAQMLVEVSPAGHRVATRSFVELEGRGDFLERGELGAAPLTSGCGLDRERQPSALGVMEEERDFRQTSPYIGPGDLTGSWTRVTNRSDPPRFLTPLCDIAQIPGHAASCYILWETEFLDCLKIKGNMWHSGETESTPANMRLPCFKFD